MFNQALSKNVSMYKTYFQQKQLSISAVRPTFLVQRQKPSFSGACKFDLLQKRLKRKDGISCSARLAAYLMTCYWKLTISVKKIFPQCS